MAYMAKHFRTTEVDPARRMFLKRSLAAMTGLMGWKLFTVVESKNLKNDTYGASPYGG